MRTDDVIGKLEARVKFALDRVQEKADDLAFAQGQLAEAESALAAVSELGKRAKRDSEPASRETPEGENGGGA